ncbi:MAG: glycosyltransferase [Pseudanabaenaceae cyanobacterium SKYGB_i_bin29]|nr:glycosyltransferase [Pseudanabaenaceae cyanobacterium SKYG29]MDW8421193.1 glycosyltransferase [Pseudanabaenaceae cyanobacterium SKYGB_i_bin29]
MKLNRSLDVYVFWAGVVLTTIVVLSSLDYSWLVLAVVNLWQWGNLYFRPYSATLQALLLPALVWFAFTFVLKEIFPRANAFSKVVVCTISAVLGLRYLLWRLFVTLNLDDWLSATVSLALFVAESVSVLNSVFFYIHNIFSLDRSAEADRWSEAVLTGRYLPTVDVLIPTYNEDAEILRRTVIGCQAMDYPRKKIYLLDDKRRSEIRELARELGCEYRDRPDNRHAKAGNINHALPTIDGELVVIFDADFVPSRNFLQRTVGFFQDPYTALVQTPQNFFNEDPITVNLGLEGIVNNEQTLFFRHIQPSRDFWGAVVCCGTCFVVRRSVLDEIGGIPTGTVTEDYYLSLRLQARGYRVKYLNEALSAGLAAETIGSFVSQRMRWGQGTLQLLFSDVNFLSVPNLSWMQRFSHGLGVLYWFLSIPRVMFLFAPLSYLLFDIAPLRATIDQLIFFYLPYYIGGVMCFSWLTENRRSAFWSDVYETLLCLPLSITILQTLISPHNKPFKVTPKGVVDPDRIRVNWILVRPLLGILLLSILGVVRHAVGWTNVANNVDSMAVNIFWVTYNSLLLLICIMAAIDVPQRRHTRFPAEEPCQLRVGEQVFEGVTIDLSEGGALLSLWQYPYCFSLRGSLRFVHPSPLAGLAIPVEVMPRQCHPEEARVGVKFLDMDLAGWRLLIPYLYCRPYQWQEVTASEWQTFWSMVVSVFRLYPFFCVRGYCVKQN